MSIRNNKKLRKVYIVKNKDCNEDVEESLNSLEGVKGHWEVLRNVQND